LPLRGRLGSMRMESRHHLQLRPGHPRDTRRRRFDLCVSQLVLEKAGKGDAEAAAKRLEALAGMPVLPVTSEALDLAKSPVGKNSLPQVATLDALHLALATVHQADVLLTWNCTHLANAVLLGVDWPAGSFARPRNADCMHA